MTAAQQRNAAAMEAAEARHKRAQQWEKVLEHGAGDGELHLDPDPVPATAPKGKHRLAIRAGDPCEDLNGPLRALVRPAHLASQVAMAWQREQTMATARGDHGPAACETCGTPGYGPTWEDEIDRAADHLELKVHAHLLADAGFDDPPAVAWVTLTGLGEVERIAQRIEQDLVDGGYTTA